MTEGGYDYSSLPEVFRPKSSWRSSVSRDVKRGKLRRIAAGLYTKNISEDLARVARRNVWRIAGLTFPGAVISDRTSLENTPALDGSVFLSSSTRADLNVPGLVFRSRKGSGPIDGDAPFVEGLFLPSPARAYLENMLPSRAGKTVARRLSRAEVEQKLDADLRNRGEAYLNELRDHAARIAPTLGLEQQNRDLQGVIGALLGTRTLGLVSDVGAARRSGQPFDPDRLDLFVRLRDELARTSAPVRRDEGKNRDDHWTNIAFFDAYFSNFIEGTEFAVEEAKEIIYEGKIPRERPEDAHDIIGTYKVAADQLEMRRTPKNTDDFFSLLRGRHAVIMSARSDKRPGQFKQTSNRAGQTIFVAPELVVGTFARGFESYLTLRDPFHRAAFMMFLVSEVHPFVDGNGRVARLMMNAELIASGERRLFVPTIERTSYLSALKAVSRGERHERYFRVLDFLQRFSAAIDFTDYVRAEAVLRRSNAFVDPHDADEQGIRLRIPDNLRQS
jgi:hypothetical protein